MRLQSTLKLGLVTLLMASLCAAAPEATAVVDVSIEPDAVFFVPNRDLDRGEITLTVSGPEEWFFEADYKEGEAGIFKIFDTEGQLIPDGQYAFNVAFRPILSSSDKATLKAARIRNDSKEIKELRREGIVRKSLTDHGYFRVFNGKFVFEDVEEDRLTSNLVSTEIPISVGSPNENNDGLVGVVLRDFVINDDLIVDGSACIGFDCINGEVFGFDTIRLKENNLRIKFDDTSVAASFPRNDWQLTANDSANGGASKFSIDDISGNRTPFTVEANARSNSLYVDDGGRIGNRTNTPSVEIHTVDGDTPTLRLQQDGTSGFQPQTWDVAGNETNFFIRDVTNGSALPLRIRPGAPTSSIFVDVDGDVGFGTASPSISLDIEDSGPVGIDLNNTAGNSWRLRSGGANFVINIPSSPEADQLVVTPNGSLKISGTCFEADSNGTPIAVTIAVGSVTAAAGTCP